MRCAPVEFLTDAEAAAYGRYMGAPSQAGLDRVFFFDNEDRVLMDRRRGTRHWSRCPRATAL